MTARFLNLGLIVALALAGLVLCIMAIPMPRALFFAIFALWPLGVSATLTKFAQGLAAHLILGLSSLLYSAWFAYVYMDTYHWGPDPKGGLDLIFVGFLSLPFFAIFWGIMVATTLATRKRLGMPDL